LLYNICYYVSPFETAGQLAILNGKYDIPQSPPFSNELKNLIAYLLIPDPDRRPNIYQAYDRVCKLRGVPCPIKNVSFFLSFCSVLLIVTRLFLP